VDFDQFEWELKTRGVVGNPSFLVFAQGISGGFYFREEELVSAIDK